MGKTDAKPFCSSTKWQMMLAWFLWLLLGGRVGEAKRPGPCSTLDDPDFAWELGCGSDIDPDGCGVEGSQACAASAEQTSRAQRTDVCWDPGFDSAEVDSSWLQDDDDPYLAAPVDFWTEPDEQLACAHSHCTNRAFWARSDGVEVQDPPIDFDDGAPFHPRSSFGGPRRGWVYKADHAGLGYYIDEPHVVVRARINDLAADHAACKGLGYLEGPDHMVRGSSNGRPALISLDDLVPTDPRLPGVRRPRAPRHRKRVRRNRRLHR